MRTAYIFAVVLAIIAFLDTALAAKKNAYYDLLGLKPSASKVRLILSPTQF